MLLLILAGLGVLVLEDEVDLLRVSTCLLLDDCWTDLIGGATFVGPKHDHIGRSVGELFGVERLVVLEQLHVCATTFKAVLRQVSHSYSGKRTATYSEA